MGPSGKRVRGTREWAVANIDCCLGCSHDCLYCYARFKTVVREGKLSAEEWRRPQLQREMVARKQQLFPGRVMFPTTHDILPEILEDCLQVIDNLLQAGNSILIVSKPHPRCIEAICREFAAHREQILFRFTITATDDSILSFWEPHAPGFAERYRALQYAYSADFQTSVSVEPMLDMANIDTLISRLGLYVTHSIWLGKMNDIDRRVSVLTNEIRREVARIKAMQTDDQIFNLFDRYKDNPLIRWKESIKEVVGILPADTPGLDI